MPVTKDDVIASLNKVAGPDGTPLPKTGTLSEIVAGDGKVFFSITVDAAVVQAWESVRSSRSLQARGASANRRPRSIFRSRFAISA